MNAEFFKALDMLEKEKGIPKEYMLEKVEAALLSGFKRDNVYSNVRIELDPVKQNVRVFKQLTVVDPDKEEDIPLTAEYNFDDFDERTDRLIEIDDTTPYGDVFDDDDSGAKPAIIRRKRARSKRPTTSAISSKSRSSRRTSAVFRHRQQSRSLFKASARPNATAWCANTRTKKRRSSRLLFPVSIR